MFQHCPVYPCNCSRCRTGVDMGMVRLVREGYMMIAPVGGRSRAANCIIDDCSTVLANDNRYPKANAIALDRLRVATGLSFS